MFVSFALMFDDFLRSKFDVLNVENFLQVVKLLKSIIDKVDDDRDRSIGRETELD